MSWLARSFANSLRLQEEEEQVEEEEDDHHFSENDITPNAPHQSSSSNPNHQQPHSSQHQQDEAIARGVKDDLTEFSQTLTRQLWGVASFLAPPPPTSNDLNLSQPSDRFHEAEASDSEEIPPISHDFVEIGGRFRTGVTEISKMASNYFPFGSDDNEMESDRGRNDPEDQELVTDEFDECEAGAIGVTDEVLAFARNIAMHPETWLDFPLDEEEDLDDFDMSDAQREHALTVEQLAPRLAALRIELCPCHMTDSYFWKVYFVLLHSRLCKHDSEILSTPQVMEARAMWMQELHKETKPEDDWFGRSISFSNNSIHTLHEEFVDARTVDSEPATSMATDYETDKHPVLSTDLQFIDKSVIAEKPVIKFEESNLLGVGPYKPILPNYEDDDDDWPDEEDSDLGSYKATMGNEEDFSFSDLEDDANYTMPIKSNTLTKGTETSKS